jgi:hypothetical protein
LAGSNDSPELASSLALRLPASRPEGRWGALAPDADVVPRIPAGTTGLFFLLVKAILSSLTIAGERLSEDRDLKKANSSRLRLMLRQELLSVAQDTGPPIMPAESRESMLLS